MTTIATDERLPTGAARRRARPTVLHVVATAAAVVALTPLIYLVVRASGIGWEAALDTLLQQRTLALSLRSVGLAAAVAATCVVVGIPLAWVITRTDVPGGRWWLVAAALPLAIPSYVTASAWVAAFPGFEGAVAAWLLIGFGLAYAGWSVVRRLGRQPAPEQVHAHGHGVLHAHAGAERHRHPQKVPSLTFWSLFIIFVLGPCEPLIPLLMAPALEHGVWAAALVAGVFAAVTVGTMLAVVVLLTLGLKLTAVRRLEAHAHTLAGLAVASSGLAIQLFGI